MVQRCRCVIKVKGLDCLLPDIPQYTYEKQPVTTIIANRQGGNHSDPAIPLLCSAKKERTVFSVFRLSSVR